MQFSGSIFGGQSCCFPRVCPAWGCRGAVAVGASPHGCPPVPRGSAPSANPPSDPTGPPGASKRKSSLHNISREAGLVLTLCRGLVETQHVGTSHGSQTRARRDTLGRGLCPNAGAWLGLSCAAATHGGEGALLRQASKESFALMFLPGQFLVFAFGACDKSSDTHRFHHSPAVFSSPPNHLPVRLGGAKSAPSQHHGSRYCLEGLGRFCFTSPSKTNSGSGRVMGASG